jgi:cardiolipin synthase A/B
LSWTFSLFTSYVSVIVGIIYIFGFASLPMAINRSRTPQGATAWCIGLVSFPMIALPLFLIFGRSKFYGYVEAHRKAAKAIQGDLNAVRDTANRFAAEAPGSLESLFKIVGTLMKSPFTRNNKVELLIDGEATYRSMLESIRGASKYILIQFYIFRDDEIGNKIAEALMEQAGRGVAVYFLYDNIGSSKLGKRFVNKMTARGVQIFAFKTSRHKSRMQINFRNHRKLLVVDGRTAHIGGLNVGDDYLGRYPNVGPWRDTHVKITGVAVLEAQMGFVKDWYWEVEQIPRLDWTPFVIDGTASVAVVNTGPADDTSFAALIHVDVFNHASKRIWIANPYFIPDEPLERALQLAVLRGVDVRCLVPARNDNWVIHMASKIYIDRLLRSGVRFFRYPDKGLGFMHQKTFLVDDVLSSVGTTNLDNRSLHINFEAQALVVDRDFALSMEQMLLNDFNEAVEVPTNFFRKRSYWYRLTAKAMNLSAPML